MPKCEPKVIQRELEAGQAWPVYWLYGAERMKSRELLKRIRRTVLGEDESKGTALGEEVLDGATVTGAEVRDAALSLSLGGGTRFIVVRDAHAMSEPEAIDELLGPAGSAREMPAVCVFLAKDLDMRRKFSKRLVERAAVVPCEEVPEREREAWIQYLAKRRQQTLSPGTVARLVALDPWALDIIDSELEKIELASGPLEEEGAGTSPAAVAGGVDGFLDAFFRRDLKSALLAAEGFAERPEEALPTLGLFAWNVRQFCLALSDRERGTRHAKLNPYVADKLGSWSRHWTLAEATQLDEELAALDHGLKQTPLLPLGLWSGVIHKFCRET